MGPRHDENLISWKSTPPPPSSVANKRKNFKKKLGLSTSKTLLISLKQLHKNRPARYHRMRKVDAIYLENQQVIESAFVLSSHSFKILNIHCHLTRALTQSISKIHYSKKKWQKISPHHGKMLQNKSMQFSYFLTALEPQIADFHRKIYPLINYRHIWSPTFAKIQANSPLYHLKKRAETS